MADTRVSALTSLNGADIVAADLIDIVDVSDTTMAASGTSKKVPITDLITALRALGDLPEMAHKTVDQSNNSATVLADVTELTFPVVANGIYAIEFRLFVVAAATTTGLVVSLNGPAIGTGYMRFGAHIPTTGTALTINGTGTYDSPIVAASTPSITIPTPTLVNAYLANGATAGTVALRMRSEVAGSNVTIQRGSWGRLTRIA